MARILIIEPELHGHKAFYLSLVVTALGGHSLTLLSNFEHPAMHEHFKRRGLGLAAVECVQVRDRAPARVFEQAVELAAARPFELVFFNYLDSYLRHVLHAGSGFDCPVSGIWFSPVALDALCRWLPPLDRRSRLRGFIHRRLRDPRVAGRLGTVFFLDPAAVGRLRRVNPRLAAAWLPDPWERRPLMAAGEARAHFGISLDCTVFLHIGSPERRKGLPDTLRAFAALGGGEDRAGRPFLFRVGPNERLRPQDRVMLESLVAAGRARMIDRFVPEAEFIECFAASDWVLIPYRGFRFSSGILANAIGAGRPVIAGESGLVGRWVRERGLGMTVRTTGARDLAACIAGASRDLAAACRPALEAWAPEISPEAFVHALAAGVAGRERAPARP